MISRYTDREKSAFLNEATAARSLPPDYEFGGREFESLRARQFLPFPCDSHGIHTAPFVTDVFSTMECALLPFAGFETDIRQFESFRAQPTIKHLILE